MSYPETPGWRSMSIGETSREAAMAVRARAPTQCALVLQALEQGPAHPEEITARIHARGHKVLLMSIRPRCSQLVRLGKIVDSGERGKGEGGCKAIVWRLATADELSLFLARKAAEDEHGEADHG